MINWSEIIISIIAFTVLAWQVQSLVTATILCTAGLMLLYIVDFLKKKLKKCEHEYKSLGIKTIDAGNTRKAEVFECVKCGKKAYKF